jgi:UDP-glucose 4-epimerase
VAIFSHRLWRGEAPTLFGFGKPTRDYVHVHDVARALLAAQGTPGTFNVSAGREVSVQEIFDGIQRAAGTELVPELAPLREGELERSCIDPSSAGRELGWRAEIDLPTGLRTTYQELIAEFESGVGSLDAR